MSAPTPSTSVTATMSRAGTAALQPETVQEIQDRDLERNRHPQSGRFINKGAAPVKQGGSRPRGKLSPS